LLGSQTNGPIGYAVDAIAIVGTLFGVAASLGYGSAQIVSGLHYVFDIAKGAQTQVIVIALITGVALASVLSGVNRGIKYLSELNMFIALILLILVFILGPSIDLIYSFLYNLANYVQELPHLSLNPVGRELNTWLGTWTLTYWGWWIAWAPFVGVFIARISKGRTIKEFVLGVLLFPTILTFLWMNVFGEQALNLAIADEVFKQTVLSDYTMAFFAFLESLPMTKVLSVVVISLICVFFVTSSDSGSLVIDMLASDGSENPTKAQKTYWALLEGAVAIVLVLSGGLATIQSVSLNIAIPFCVVMLFMIWSLVRALKEESAN